MGITGLAVPGQAVGLAVKTLAAGGRAQCRGTAGRVGIIASGRLRRQHAASR